MFRRAFIEITNECNLSCGFCAVSSRPAVCMAPGAFEDIAVQVKPFARVISLHVLGEPFMHPRFPEILNICSRLGLSVNLVTNGTLLDKFGPAVFAERCLVQVSFSLHALAALPSGIRAEKLRRLTEFAAVKPDRLIVGFRLRGVMDDPFVKEASDFVLNSFPGRVNPEEHGRAVTLRDNVYLNFGELFDWPGRGPGKTNKGCLGLRHHFAILSTGEVVPCCADHDGRLAIGNINKKPLADILSGPAVPILRDSIAGHTAMPSYCATCGFSAPD
ncbi:MAG: radical SAM/SPASM domain-containing protein [Elusimicrobiota bacterium]